MEDRYLESSSEACKHYCKVRQSKALSVPNLLHVELHTEADEYKLLLGSQLTLHPVFLVK